MQGSLPCGSVVSIYVGLCILILHTYRTQTSYFTVYVKSHLQSV